MLGGTKPTFIRSEDEILMPAGGTGFYTGSSLGEPVLFFSGTTYGRPYQEICPEIYTISLTSLYTSGFFLNV